MNDKEVAQSDLFSTLNVQILQKCENYYTCNRLWISDYYRYSKMIFVRLSTTNTCHCHSLCAILLSNVESWYVSLLILFLLILPKIVIFMSG